MLGFFLVRFFSLKKQEIMGAGKFVLVGKNCRISASLVKNRTV